MLREDTGEKTSSSLQRAVTVAVKNRPRRRDIELPVFVEVAGREAFDAARRTDGASPVIRRHRTERAVSQIQPNQYSIRIAIRRHQIRPGVSVEICQDGLIRRRTGWIRCQRERATAIAFHDDLRTRSE